MENPGESRPLEVGPAGLRYINSTRKWTMFFAVIGFIMVGLMLIAAVVAGAFMSSFIPEGETSVFNNLIIAIIIVAVSLIYLFPVLFLFRFSVHSRNAIHNHDSVQLEKALKNLKAYFVYLGVLLIILLVIYAIGIVVAGSSLAFFRTL